VYTIGVIGGDGIGPEVTREAVKVLKAVSKVFGFRCRLVSYPFGADHYLKTSEIMPTSALDEFRGMDAILLGAIGDPRVAMGLLERGIVGAMRFELDLYANMRPVRLFAERLCPLKEKKPADIDFIVVRENTEDVYIPMGGFMRKGTRDEVAVQSMMYTRKGVERIIRHAFDVARKRRGKNKLLLCDKANAVLTHDLWRRVFAEVGKEYPDVKQEAAFVDAVCMWMVKNPENFDVIVTTNMFGDIITDLAAMIQGGMGVAAGGNIHPGRVSMFEPIHGSAPKYKGKNVACPLGAILAAGMLCEHVGEPRAAHAIEKAVEALLVSERIPSVSADGLLGTDDVGDMVAGELKKLNRK
jgi:3-isopropylmalate dehydrogenase